MCIVYAAMLVIGVLPQRCLQIFFLSNFSEYGMFSSAAGDVFSLMDTRKALLHISRVASRLLVGSHP
jgi:hypothetical protein